MVSYDILIMIILTFLFLVFFIFKRAKILRKNRRKDDFLKPEDLFVSIFSSALIYGGISAVWLAIYGKLLFNQDLVISKEYITGVAGLIFLWLGFYSLREAIKKINLENEKKENKIDG